MTAIHLINRPPSRAIEFKRPIEIMEQHFPTVRLRSGLVPRVFGCVTYVYAQNMQIDKLSTKAVKVVFVGYFNTQKGYYCYHPSSKKFFETRDVVFDEHTFFY